MQKNEVVETQEAIKIIVNTLSNSDINLQLTDNSGSFDILLDENAKRLLESYYKSKLSNLSY